MSELPAATTDQAHLTPELIAERQGNGRFLDRGAVFAGWVGLGMGLVIAIAFELIVAIQPLVFLLALPAGAIIGAYANVRSERWRPRGRVLANSAYAGVVTGIGLALLYVAIRLLFIYADSGYRVDTQGGQLSCVPGPACTYERYLAAGRGPELTASGVTDGASFEAFVLSEHLSGGLTLLALSVGGALIAGGLRASRTPPFRQERSRSTSGYAVSDAADA
ncbi:MAG: hypothetical protein H0T04_00825 [Chloroflexi bacterium]|nr:hypothetical protein [Chloroflexota bacterium]